MKHYEGYLIDLDGTMYRGLEKIEEALQFVEKLKEHGIPYLFVTNNSSKRPEQFAQVLEDFGLATSAEQVFTTSMATANFLHEKKPGASVYAIGGEGLHSALTEKGFQLVEEKADAVVIGLDREITYEKLAKACLAVRNGAMFISTNGDIALPSERGLLPGNGALTSVISVSTQTEPIFIGKPHSIIVEQALTELGTSKEGTLMVGDNYDTDILAGIQAGLDTLLVHTGVTTRDMLIEKMVQPTYVLDSLADWKLNK
ncbi:TIGR01457 family HAD-type hydrolase [Lederbergia galactosidilytica]|uniref:Acid sugar phosphatase n=1 Tax=Lederbergia galactosidilytica TaxID=217031 RepID=A0A177ZJ55_9BACI|nr:TIGR01457 family HAD-type hydrolase [Lederbergia galactosidilytica]KRG15199.1 HAD family hydrolase [Virgibacillus soli]MBP1913141.1 4-nitrophenyl phosphatase [Lederbergia galactosidilytica]OAK67835.1 HAD family hydrolase [Lederbergia galactosidilytica]